MARSSRPSRFDDLVRQNRRANFDAADFAKSRQALDELADAAYQAKMRGEPVPARAFVAIAAAAEDLSLALDGAASGKPLEMIRKPAAGLAGRLARRLA